MAYSKQSALLALVTAVTSTITAGIFFKANITVSSQTSVSSASIQWQELPLAAYERVNTGMTLTESQVILGPGTEVSSSTTMATYVWQDRSGQSITATFESGILVRKSRDFQ